MTLMGQKRKDTSKNERKRPAKPRTVSKTGCSDKAQEYRAFMDSFRGLPDIINGRTESKYLTDSKGNPLKTEGHHLLHQSTHPEHRLNHENVVPLTRENHEWTERYPNLFKAWLKEERPYIYEWMIENNHHRKD